MDTLREHLRKAGRIGGRVMTPRRRRALLRNLVKARAAKARKAKQAKRRAR